MRTNLHHGEFLLRSELIELAAIATISFHAASRFAERTDKALSPESLRNYIVHSRMAFFQADGRIILMGDNTSEYFILNRMERVSHLSSLRMHKTHCLTNL